MSTVPNRSLASLQNTHAKFPLSSSGFAAFALAASFIGLSNTPTHAADSFISIKWGKSVAGSGKIVEVKRTVPAFDHVIAKDGLRVVLRQGASQKVVVKADDNIEPLIETTVSGNTLTLRPKPNASFKTREGITVSVDYVQLSSLAVSDGVSADIDAIKSTKFSAHARDGSALRVADVTASDFELKVNDGASATLAKVSAASTHSYKVSDAGSLTINSIIGEQVNAVVSDGAKMTLRGVDLKAIDVKVSDGASANIEGNASQQSFSVSDGASVDTQKLDGQFARVRASDGGAMKLGKVQSLDVDARDGSVVRYSGEPTVTQKMGDGAKLRKM
jgi:Putative auto-transporter adhesin, head GIN domain